MPTLTPEQREERRALVETDLAAYRAVQSAASHLAYDVVIRAEDPRGDRHAHERASTALSRQLKDEYRAAHEASAAARIAVEDFDVAHGLMEPLARHRKGADRA